MREDKNRRYRQNRIAEGKCPHCGKLCAPFYECEDRRAYKRKKGPIVFKPTRPQGFKNKNLMKGIIMNPDELLKLAQQLEPARKAYLGEDYLPIIKILREEKFFSWAEIFKFFSEKKVEISSCTIRSVYRRFVENIKSK